MNIRSILSLLLTCIFCFSCTQKQSSPTGINTETGIQIKLEGYDPNTTAIVTLKLEGETLPGTPRVVSADDTSSALFEQIGFAEDIRPVVENIWIAILKHITK